jgi:signal transduction histidine kinase
MKWSTLSPASNIRAVLVTGFVAVFGLWLVSGFNLLQNVREVEQRVGSLHNACLRGEQTLSTVRTNVLLGSIYLRDALIDNSVDTRPFYRDELHRIRAEIEQRLPAYLPEVESKPERQEWSALQEALTEYWETLDLLSDPKAPTNYVQGAGLVRRQVVPARENVLQIVDRISELQRLSAERQERESQVLYAQIRSRFVAVGSVTIVLAALIAAFAFIRVRSLERELEHRRVMEAKNRQDLARLSARLVDAQEDERRHLSRELHDEVGQALTAIKMEIGVAMRTTAADARARASLEEARVIAERTLQGVRDLSQLLHPSMLDDFGLRETLTAYVRSFEKRSGVHTELTHAGLEERLPTDVEVCVYRIVQEALTNVARHSGASWCSVEVVRQDGQLRLSVEDDGRGVPSVTDVTRVEHGLGVIGMRERAQALGGQFVIQRRAQGGTRIVVMLPAVGEHATEEPERRAG